MSWGKENNFTAIRLIAAISVLYGHSYRLLGIPVDPTSLFFNSQQYIGSIAVDVFFVTSGFLLARSSHLNQSLVDFVVARVLRIYPGLIVCNAVLIIASMATFHSWDWSFLVAPDTVSYFSVNSSMVSNEVVFFLPGVFDGLPNSSVNGSFWTLPAEIKAYTYMAFFIAISLTLRAKDLGVPMVILYLGMAAMAAVAYPALPGLWDALDYQRLIIFFFVGAAMFEVRAALPLYSTVALGFCAGLVFLRSSHWLMPFTYIAYPYLILFAAYKLPFAKRLNAVDISYGIYIYGFFSQNLVVWAVPTATPLIVFLSGFGIAIVPATLSWFLVEKPALELKRKLRLRLHHPRLSVPLARSSVPPPSGFSMATCASEPSQGARASWRP